MVKKRTRRVKPLWADDDLTYPGVLGESEGKLSLADVVDENYASLKNSFNQFRDRPNLNELLDRWQINGSFDDFKQWIMGQIDEGQITNVTIVDWHADLASQASENSNVVPLHLSCIFTILSRRAYQHKEIEKAWALVTKACYFAGLLASVIEVDQFKTNAAERRDKATKAGQARIKNFDPNKEKVISLLMNPPDGGWGDELPTRKILKPLLDKYLEEKFNENKSDAPSGCKSLPKSHLTTTNSQSTLAQWFKDDDKIREAYRINSSTYVKSDAQ